MTVRFSTREITQIGLYTVAGSLLGALYRSLQIFSNRRITTKLMVEHEALHEDEMFLVYLKLLEDAFHQFDEVAYIRTVDACDKIVALHLKLRNGSCHRVPSLVDFAHAQVQKIRKSLKRLRITVMNYPKSTPAEVVELDSLSEKIFECVSRHFRGVVMEVERVFI